MSLMPFDASILDGVYELDTGAVAAVVTASGSYSGNSTTNRAIPHGLGATPKQVNVLMVTTGGSIEIMDTGKTHFHNPSSTYILDITAMDDVNFYVGNATNYSYSGNTTGGVYHWVAIA